MSLRSKLQRLGPPTSVEPAPSGASPSGPRSTTPAVVGGERRDTLEELRRKMRELLGADPAVRGGDPADPSGDARASCAQADGLGELPFVERAFPEGPLFQRCERLASSRRVGRIPIDAAGSASADMLALLALDPTLADCDPRGALFLDTETTGLGGAGSLAFLVGLCWHEPGRGWVLEQLLLRSPAEEAPVLRRVSELMEQASLLVTYNGKSFDRPLLDTRLVMNRMPALPARPHLDLLSVARRIHKRRLGSCRLIHLESEVLGWQRSEDDVPGYEIPARYGHFLRTGDGEVLRAVVDHNAWDVLSMAALVGLYGEPLPPLHGEDLVAMARTLRRAGDLERAWQVADAAWAQGAGPEALRARGEIAKARGDRARALLDFEALSAEIDDPTVRLELAKLYEHHLGEPASALAMVEAGTGETELAWMRRRSRLQQKLERQRARGCGLGGKSG